MRIHFKRPSTGLAYLPALARPVTFDTASLSAEDAAELEQLVSAARFFDQPEESQAPAAGRADFREFVVTVEEGDRSHTVRLSDPVEDPDLRNLLEYLQTNADSTGTQ